MSDLRRLETKLDSMSNNLMERMVNELNDRDIGGGMHHATQIQEQLRILNDKFKALRNRICGDDGDESVRGYGERPNYLSGLTYHSYGGRYNLLPQNFILPSLTLSAFISYFLLGNKETGVPPLRLINPRDIKHSGTADGSKPNIKIVTDMRRMMKYVEEAARDAEVWENNPKRWDSAKITHMYEKTKHRYMVPPKKGRWRYESLMWKSYLNILKSNKGLMAERRVGVEVDSYSALEGVFITLRVSPIFLKINLDFN